MNTDIRIDVRLPRHRKYKKLKRIIGPATMEHLVTFWGTVAEQVPNGALNGWSTEDIEDAAGWDGESGVFFAALVESEFLDETESGYYPHDWHEHQPWVVGAEERSESARKAGLASAEARRNKAARSADVQRTVDDPLTIRSTDAQRKLNPRTPSPSPSPLPSPKPEEPPHIPPGGGVRQADALFELFWQAYPKKIGKDAARKAFAKRRPSRTMTEIMIAAVEQQMSSPQWARDGGQFIPHPATWLNQGRWEDDVGGTAGNVTDWDALIKEAEAYDAQVSDGRA